ncbi:MOSC domain-containing protein [Georgenia sp. Z1491]|uniref:MOSC domain-containing protein n=1 Tax=Georgenia sp. Z1491 TaxID=3416707 RepID=UPI003CE8C8FA
MVDDPRPRGVATASPRAQVPRPAGELGPELGPVVLTDGPATVAAVCSVAQLFHVGSRGLMSGIDKRPVDRPLTVLRHGVWGDVQGDRENHGGLFKAVYAYASETRQAWADAVGTEYPPGAFGENLVTSGIDVDEAVIGTRWRVGTTVLRVTSPRTPCRTFAAWMGEPDWSRRFTAGGRCGAYLGVEETGEIAAGDDILVEDVPEHGVSVGDAFRGLDADRAGALLDWAEASGTVLYETLVRRALDALSRGGHEREFPGELRSTGRGLGGGAR